MRALALSLVVASSCTATKAFVVSGESIDALGQQFVAVSKAMRVGVESGAVTPEQFKAWAVFSDKFDAAYGKSVSSWRAARAIKDDVAAGNLESAIGALAVELAGFYAVAVDLKLVKQ